MNHSDTGRPRTSMVVVTLENDEPCRFEGIERFRPRLSEIW